MKKGIVTVLLVSMVLVGCGKASDSASDAHATTSAETITVSEDTESTTKEASHIDFREDDLSEIFGSDFPDSAGMGEALEYATSSIGVTHVDKNSFEFGNYDTTYSGFWLSVKFIDSDTGKTLVAEMLHSDLGWETANIQNYYTGHYYYFEGDASIYDVYDYKTEKVIKEGAR